ncbi:MAG: hypothetical protein JHC95_01140 [Solirubrobacteraceae bacterium]|nr:hypothetical protein [Solirubrobacteraceae bacterium]
MPTARRVVLAAALAFIVAAIPAGAVAPAVSAQGDGATPVPALVVGDSLAVGTKPFLDELLPGYSVTWDAKSGRTTPQGLVALRARLREVTPAVVVISLGSNDGSSASRFQDRMRRVLALVPPTSCVIWPSIVRPPRKGEESGLNRVLRKMAKVDKRLVLIEWRTAVLDGVVHLPDGLHPDAAGYQARSGMVATAVQRGCLASGGGAPPTGGAVAP